MQREVLIKIIPAVGLFANTNKEVSLTKHLECIKEDLGEISPSTKTMYTWYVHYQKYGELPDETKERNKGRKRVSTSKWSKEQFRQLKLIVHWNPHLYLDEIADRYNLRFPSKEEMKTENQIWYAMRYKMNYRLKVYTEITAQRSEQERNRFRRALKLMVRNNRMVILIDETAKDKNTSRRRRMWALRGQKAVDKDIRMGLLRL